jgi:hypothetical protein
MATRFEIARAIGSGSAGLFKPEGPQAWISRDAVTASGRDRRPGK